MHACPPLCRFNTEARHLPVGFALLPFFRGFCNSSVIFSIFAFQCSSSAFVKFFRMDKVYKTGDYLRNGMLFVNNNMFQRHKKLSSLMIYATSLCQSRCRHCMIWNKEVVHMPKDEIVKIMQSKCITSATSVGLEGGEFILHPQADEILAWFKENHPNYHLLSNCLAPEKVIDAVRKYTPARLYVSLDGDAGTYRNMRGRDGYDKVIKVVEECRGLLPVSLMFCLSPFNSLKDMEHVINVAKKYDIDVRIGVYGNMAFFDTTEDQETIDSDDFISKIPENIHATQENYDFLALYDQWRKGALELGCHSIRSSLVIHPDGNVPVCQNLDVFLGNVYEKSLDEIFNSAASCAVQKKYVKCNGCWINFHRKYDIVLLRNFEKVLPKKLIEAGYGKYCWSSDRTMTYREFLKSKGQ